MQFVFGDLYKPAREKSAKMNFFTCNFDFFLDSKIGA